MAFSVAYDNDLVVNDAYHSADAQALAQPGSHTRDEGWRDSLKEGDTVDVLDSKGKW